MRITTQMLNASMRKAGLPINNVSLLNYVNGSSSQNNSLLSALNKNGIKVNDKSYEKLKGLAESLQESAVKMSSGMCSKRREKAEIRNRFTIMSRRW